MTFRRHWSDYVGFLFFISFAVWQLQGARTIQELMLWMPAWLDSLVMAFCFLTRRPLVRKVDGVTPRLIAYAVTLGFYVFWNIALRFWPGEIRANADVHIFTLGIGIQIVAPVLSVLVVFFLRPAMSIEPQARVLITSGPYRLARHPLYATYCFASIGLFLQFTTVLVAVALLVWTAALIVRACFEERTLYAAFPEYEQYRQRVWMFCPSLTAPANWSRLPKSLTGWVARGE